MKSLSGVESRGDRNLIANFTGNPKTSVIVTYSPTNASSEDELEKYYKDLQGCIESIPAHNFLLILGDFNARLGKDAAKHTMHQHTNRNGKLLDDLIMEKDLVACNTCFQKRVGKLWTFMGPGGHKAQIDYILVRRKWRNSVLNCEAYSSFANVGSDHRVVSAKIRLSLKSNCKAPPKRVLYDWNEFSKNTTLQERYCVEVRNKFNTLADDSQTATELYEHFIEANEVATAELVPPATRRKSDLINKDPRVVQARSKAKVIYREYQINSTEENRIAYEEAKRDIDNSYARILEEQLDNKIKEIEQADKNCKHGLSWKLINDVTGRKTSTQGQLEGDTQAERVRNWYSHFYNLLGKPPTVDDEDEEIEQIFPKLNIKEGPFTMDEYKKAKSELKLGKAAGDDGIRPEVLKLCNLDDIILKFCNRALTKRESPDQWKMSNLVCIPKLGDLSKGGNYRGISLGSLVFKTRNRMMLHRIRPELDKKLRFNQNGFRPGRSTVSQILALRRIIEGVKRNNLPAIITFIDFTKAFDTIHRGKMVKILRAYGIPEELVVAIDDMYKGTKAKVLSPDGETEPFEISSGVLQGDTLAPYLFIIVLDYALRKAINGREEELGFCLKKRRSRRIGPETITDLDFADDIALLSEQIVQAQNLLTGVEVQCGKIGLKINAKKTKTMVFNITDPVTIYTQDGSELEIVTDFKYLGSLTESTESDIRARKASAWRACNKLKKIWKSALSRSFKIRLFQAVVESVLVYGSEAWTLTASLERQLNGCYTRLLRCALNIDWRDHITNEVLYGDLPPLSTKLRSRRLQFAGHCFRAKDEAVSKVILWTPTHGQKSRGRPATTYVDLLTSDTGLRVEELETSMMERCVWRDTSFRDPRVSS